jgi:hypothetical protein
MAKVKDTAKWGTETAKARYGVPKDSGVTPAPDEQPPQFNDDKVADHIDSDGWVRGKGKDSPYPTFDHGKLDKRSPK